MVPSSMTFVNVSLLFFISEWICGDHCFNDEIKNCKCGNESWKLDEFETDYCCNTDFCELSEEFSPKENKTVPLINCHSGIKTKTNLKCGTQCPKPTEGSKIAISISKSQCSENECYKEDGDFPKVCEEHDEDFETFCGRDGKMCPDNPRSKFKFKQCYASKK